MPDASSAGSLYLLDAHGLIFQMFHGIGPMTAPDGRPTNAVFGVTRSLMTLYDRGADYLIAALDTGVPTFRATIDPNYKAHRDPVPEDLLLQEPMIQQVMEGMRIPFVHAPAGFEADDVMATVASEAAARGLDVFICSADKDCRQLLTNTVKILNLRKGEEINAATLMADWGVRPDQVIDFQALVGDTADNVPGVPGVGPKTAAKWLQQFGTLDAIIAHANEVPGGPKVKESLKATIASGKLADSKAMVTLDTRVPLNIDWTAWKRRDWDGQRLLELFHEFGFRGFAERVRKTLTSSGAKKNAEVLSISGEPGDASRRVPVPPPGDSRRPAHAAPSLFDAIDEFADADFAVGTNAAAEPTDGWSYAGYRLIDTEEAFAEFLASLKAQTRFTFDLETTGLDPLRSEPVGLAFCWQEGEAYYLPVRGPVEDKVLDPSAVLAALKPVFEDAAIAKVNQNIKYDLLVLESHGIRAAKIAGDPMIAHYLLHAGARSHNLDEMTREFLKHENISITELIGKGKKQLTMDRVRTATVRDYAAEDADTAFRLAAILEPQLEAEGLRTLYDELEIPLIGVLAELEFTGIRLDVPLLQKLSVEMESQLAAIEADIYALAGESFNIASPKQLGVVLFDKLKLPIQKRTGTTGAASTDAESLERLAALGHALPRKIVEHRQIAKLKGTYVDALPLLVNPKTGRLHTSFNQTVAATGRLSSSDPNLQNIPARTDQGKQIRQAFLPREGWQIVTADYSQIELRLLAEFSQDEALRTAFTEDRDIHSRVAAQIFKVPETDVTSAQRRVAKTVNFGVIYGMSGSGLAIRLGITKAEADGFINDYFHRFPKVLDYQQQVLAKANAQGYVQTILGRKRTFDANSIRPRSSFQSRNTAEREAINMEIQGSAADLMKRALLGVSRRLQVENRRAKMLLTVHDELVFEAPPDEVAAVAQLAREEMTTAITLTVPLKVDVAAGPNWLDVNDV